MRVAITALCGLGACGFQPAGSGDHSGDAAIDAARLADATPDAHSADAHPPDAAVRMPTIVQQETAYAQGNKTLSQTLPDAPTTGDVLLMIGAANLSGPLDSVTGGGVVQWTRAESSDVRANTEIWYGVTTGVGSTVTIALAANNGNHPIWMDVVEVSDLDVTNLVQTGAASAGTASPAKPGNVTLASGPELVVLSAADTGQSTFGAPSGGPWTALTPIAHSDVTQVEYYQIANAVETIDPSLSETTHDWDAAIVALRVAQ